MRKRLIEMNLGSFLPNEKPDKGKRDLVILWWQIGKSF
jgi:hypothetical protein